MTIRTYSELSKLKTFEERLHYLMLDGVVGETKFGYERYLNQRFYRSPEWKKIRRQVILRDNGNDLGVEGHQIYGRMYVHHMNPITKDDICKGTEYLLNPEYMITVSYNTHQAITYGTESTIPKPVVERQANDTCPWR